VNEIIESAKTAIQAKSIVEYAVLGIFLAVLYIMWLSIRRQVSKLTDAANGITKSSRSVNEAAHHVSQIEPKIIDAAAKISSATENSEDMLRQIGRATNQMQAAKSALAELLEELNKTPSITELANRSAVLQTQSAEELSRDYWDEVRSMWQEAKEFLEQHVEQISDGRTLRRYAGISRHTHYDLIKALQADDKVSKISAQAATDMNKIYLQFRPRTRAVDVATRNDFKNKLQTLKTT
jgi:septal ring factor EnvC (AmiA/AmiB activator)